MKLRQFSNLVFLCLVCGPVFAGQEILSDFSENSIPVLNEELRRMDNRISNTVGPKGDKGDTGPSGPAGSNGTSATVTGDSGTSASVNVGSTTVNSGTTNDAIFDFTIPKGDKGDAGDVSAASNLILTGHVVGGDGTSNPYQKLRNGSLETWTGLTDVLTNGGMETWTNPTTLTTWVLSGAGATQAQETTIKKAGTYSAKVTNATSTVAHLSQTISGTDSYKNKTVTLGAWVYSSAASRVNLQIYDGVGISYSSYHSGSAGWEYLTVTRTCSSSSTGLYVYLYVYAGVSINTYFDSAIVYEQIAPTGWTFSGAGASVVREEGIIGNGTYSVKLARNGANCSLRQDVTAALGGLAAAKGNTVTVGVRSYCLVASRAYIYIDTGTGGSSGSVDHGGTGWEYISVTKTIPNDADYIYIYIYILTGDATAYFDEAMVNEGFTPFAFSEPLISRTSAPVVVDTDESKFSHKVPVVIDGTTYYVMLTAT